MLAIKQIFRLIFCAVPLVKIKQNLNQIPSMCCEKSVYFMCLAFRFKPNNVVNFEQTVRNFQLTDVFIMCARIEADTHIGQ